MKNKKNDTSATPYDDAFRTMITDSSRLAVSLINEMFGKQLPMDAKTVSHQNEMYLVDGEKRITDSILQFEGTETLYHTECESVAGDAGILIRLFEYDSKASLRNAEIDGNTLRVTFPQTGVLYLQDTKNTPDEMTMVVRAPDTEEELSLRVYVMKRSNYSLKNIIQQNLLFLLPFYIFRYKSGLQSQVESRVIKTETQALAALKKIKKELDKLNQAGIINIYERSMLEELTVRVAKAMAKNSECIMKEVDDIMGGQVLDYEAKDILNKGREEGREEGRAEGIRTVVHLCKKHGGFMQDAIDEIVDMMNLSQDEAENMVKKYW